MQSHGLSLAKSVPEWDAQSHHRALHIQGFFLYLAFNYTFFGTCQCCQQDLEAAGRGGDGWLVEDSSWTHLTVGWTLPRCWVGAQIVAVAEESQQRRWESARGCVSPPSEGPFYWRTQTVVFAADLLYFFLEFLGLDGSFPACPASSLRMD